MTYFNDFLRQESSGLHTFQSGGGTYKVRIIDDTTRAAYDDATPVITDYTEVSGGTYAEQTLANQDVDENDEILYIIADSTTFAQDAGAGPTDCFQAIVYLDSGTKPCVAFIELTLDGGTTPLSLQDAPIVLNWGSGTTRLFKKLIEANAA
jgi:hypothetical protein